MPADTTSSPPARSARRSALARRRRRRSASPCAVLGTPAEESGGGKDPADRARRLRRRPRRDDGPSRSPIDVADAARSSPRPVRRALHRQGGARRGVPRARHQRRRRAGPSPRPPSACCASTSARPTASTASSPTAATRRTSCPAHTAAALHRPRARRSTTSRSCARRVERCFEAGALATGATLDASSGDDRLRRHASTTPSSPRSTARNAEALGRVFLDDRSALERAGLDRHGQRVARVPSIHPDDRHRLAPRASTISPSSPRLRHARGRPGALDGALGDGLDGHRPGSLGADPRPPAVPPDRRQLVAIRDRAVGLRTGPGAWARLKPEGSGLRAQGSRFGPRSLSVLGADRRDLRRPTCAPWALSLEP